MSKDDKEKIANKRRLKSEIEKITRSKLKLYDPKEKIELMDAIGLAILERASEPEIIENPRLWLAMMVEAANCNAKTLPYLAPKLNSIESVITDERKGTINITIQSPIDPKIIDPEYVKVVSQENHGSEIAEPLQLEEPNDPSEEHNDEWQEPFEEAEP